MMQAIKQSFTLILHPQTEQILLRNPNQPKKFQTILKSTKKQRQKRAVVRQNIKVLFVGREQGRSFTKRHLFLLMIFVASFGNKYLIKINHSLFIVEQIQQEVFVQEKVGIFFIQTCFHILCNHLFLPLLRQIQLQLYTVLFDHYSYSFSEVISLRPQKSLYLSQAFHVLLTVGSYFLKSSKFHIGYKCLQYYFLSFLDSHRFYHMRHHFQIMENVHSQPSSFGDLDSQLIFEQFDKLYAKHLGFYGFESLTVYPYGLAFDVQTYSDRENQFCEVFYLLLLHLLIGKPIIFNLGYSLRTHLLYMLQVQRLLPLEQEKLALSLNQLCTIFGFSQRSRRPASKSLLHSIQRTLANDICRLSSGLFEVIFKLVIDFGSEIYSYLFGHISIRFDLIEKQSELGYDCYFFYFYCDFHLFPGSAAQFDGFTRIEIVQLALLLIKTDINFGWRMSGHMKYKLFIFLSRLLVDEQSLRFQFAEVYGFSGICEHFDRWLRQKFQCYNFEDEVEIRIMGVY